MIFDRSASDSDGEGVIFQSVQKIVQRTGIQAGVLNSCSSLGVCGLDVLIALLCLALLVSLKGGRSKGGREGKGQWIVMYQKVF